LGFDGIFSKPTLNIKGNKIEFGLRVGPNSEAYGGIVLDFVPKGKKNLDLYNDTPNAAEEVAKWASSKTRLPAIKGYRQPSNLCRVILNTNSILKKLK